MLRIADSRDFTFEFINAERKMCLIAAVFNSSGSWPCVQLYKQEARSTVIWQNKYMLEIVGNGQFFP